MNTLKIFILSSALVFSGAAFARGGGGGMGGGHMGAPAPAFKVATPAAKPAMPAGRAAAPAMARKTAPAIERPAMLRATRTFRPTYGKYHGYSDQRWAATLAASVAVTASAGDRTTMAGKLPIVLTKEQHIGS